MGRAACRGIRQRSYPIRAHSHRHARAFPDPVDGSWSWMRLSCYFASRHSCRPRLAPVHVTGALWQIGSWVRLRNAHARAGGRRTDAMQNQRPPDGDERSRERVPAAVLSFFSFPGSTDFPVRTCQKGKARPSPIQKTRSIEFV